MSLMAQAQSVIDEVIWIVGDEAILRSEVEEERLRAQYEGQQISGDPYCVIPEQLAIQKLFLHQAELDSVEANESTVSHQVDMRLNYYINQIGSKEKMEEYFRKTSSDDDHRPQPDDYSADAAEADVEHQADAVGDTPVLSVAARRLDSHDACQRGGTDIEFRAAGSYRGNGAHQATSARVHRACAERKRRFQYVGSPLFGRYRERQTRR